MKHWQPTLANLCCHCLTGTASVSTRYLVNVLDPVEIAFLRYFFGGLAVMFLFSGFRFQQFNRELLLKTAGLGIIFFAIFPFLFSWAFVYTNAARGALVLATMPIWAMLISEIIGHEKITAMSIYSIGLTLLGLLIALSDKLTTGANQFILFKGELIMLLTALLGAIYAIYARGVLREVSAASMTPVAMLVGCFCLLPFVAWNGIDVHVMALTPGQMLLMVYLGVIAGGIAFFLFNWALNKTTATYTTLFVVLNPITAIFLGNLFLGEKITLNFIIGVVIVFAGLGLAVRAQMRAHQLQVVC